MMSGEQGSYRDHEKHRPPIEAPQTRPPEREKPDSSESHPQHDGARDPREGDYRGRRDGFAFKSDDATQC